ncbi:bifunctional alpha,alpha-trehalose-phosphate synthase (UDP-forming)/trehalose-phosphatase [Alkalitalea saponilacus]|uniref:Trehalose 6-phosphate synthase/phosphatase n=1 Tax=Alkalitalea saponilacus TaxID=889453 RepID=A0A1T5HKC2_9BACT|nr:bifunctional alpha,alpha-trehalose-phosphate synthase (UDP-forming)/trehalose-phosphatase [Alkalitalea saponilacus]ASB47769.1 bifunctional alpha,alpha-trehalose-phosphate synthase (UDP-forming)/trehalose-phosphatase [Alkalitalea saponilacus]SKC21124.1 trehalose 6-phosphate synthase/phosphatase [Alkalitalea saponilacus]
MKKLHIVSNRLPYSVDFVDGSPLLTPSVGGLATGMNSVYKEYNGNWIGWPGVASDSQSPADLARIDALLEKEGCVSVHLSNHEVEEFYEGFCNNTIWPLFHYFAQYVDFHAEFWDAYVKVNQIFAHKTLEVIDDGDYVWVHDYQLMLVPEMIKSKKPNITIGYFLHIPFPSYEVFRILPWRDELLKGLLGADLIGFHTYDYERHFLSSVRRLFGYEITFNEIHIDDRIILADAFPMGIDYKKFEDAAIKINQTPLKERSEVHRELEKYFLMDPDRKLVLSIDRLDYSKGIPNRLRAFGRFLENHPEYRGKVTLILLSVPSRNNVIHYQRLRSEVEELVGSINGLYGNINYTPVWYFYRTMPFQNLVELYSMCDVALITPVRDGMNLVAKEYVASRINKTGVMVLSEMAGVVKEMGEAIIINPNDENQTEKAILQALEMPVDEQRKRLATMQERLKRYDVFKWAKEFVGSLQRVNKIQKDFLAKKITPEVGKSIIDKFENAGKRAIFLDYDGTLTGFKADPQEVQPDAELKKLIDELTESEKNIVTIISGRDKETLSKWFEGHQVNLICEHGVWLRRIGEDWNMLTNASNSWMPTIRPVLESYVDRTPGSFLEEKNYSLVWHFRRAEAELGELRAKELRDELTELVANHNLEIMEGNKVVEVKTGGINKGAAANSFLLNMNADFIMGIGDDWTDEFLFKELPETAITVKVGIKHTNAAYKLETVEAVRAFLKKLSKKK